MPTQLWAGSLNPDNTTCSKTALATNKKLTVNGLVAFATSKVGRKMTNPRTADAFMRNQKNATSRK